MSYTYNFVAPTGFPPFKKIIRRTRGEYIRTTEPCEGFGFRYAIFRNRASELWIPLHDLTPETKARIGPSNYS